MIRMPISENATILAIWAGSSTRSDCRGAMKNQSASTMDRIRAMVPPERPPIQLLTTSAG
ncbi:MAG: hypothetical protein CVU19_13810 [Betaproteobacteria bacterium HGW-Betaproteobacteria-13]|nr:MAG: hypothetical protein CVU19_13810 [Betaproteobacteria bacterium HGW-Betaproteobacteria-13]